VKPERNIEKLNSITSTLLSVAEGEADLSLLTELKEFSLKIQQGKFYLSVAGLFKRGKSSIINALLDKNIAPVAITPLTAIVTLFEFGEAPLAEVHYLNGTTDQIKIEHIPLYVTEDENPDNTKQVSFVRIYNDADFLRHVTLIDTPGIGSVLEHNTFATQSFIPKVDAILFVLSADFPVSKEDIAFLQKVKENKISTLFTLNKTDLLEDAELNKILQYNQRAIESSMTVKQVEILPVSAREYTAGKNSIHNGIDSLRAKVDMLFTNQKDSLLFETSVRQFEVLLARVETILQLKLEILQSPYEELGKKQEALQHSIGIMNASKEDFQILVQGKIRQLQDYIHAYINDWKRNFEKELDAEIDLRADEIARAMLKGQNSVQAELIHRIVHAIEMTKSALENQARYDFRTLLQHYSQQSQSFINELSQQLHSLMGIDFNLLIGVFDLNIYTAFYFRTAPDIRLPDFSSNIAYRLLPETTVRKKIITRLKINIHEIMVINSANTIYDLQYRIQESFRKFNYDLNLRLTDLLKTIGDTIQTTMEEKKSADQSVKGKVENLQEKLFKANQLKEQMHGYQGQTVIISNKI
jgi:ribosome biogenesis GTPase A